MDDHQATTMPEEAAILKINELIDALFEQSEESVLRLDVNQRKFERSGKFAAKKNEKNEFLVLNRFGGDKNKKICTIESSSRSPSSSSSLTKTLISSGKSGGKSPSTASSSLRTRNSVTSQGKSLEYEPSLLCLDPESYEILSQSSLSTVSKADKKKKNQNSVSDAAATAAAKGIDIFRFPIIGENPMINSKDYIYFGLDSKKMLVFRNLQDGSVVDEKEMKAMEKYYKMLKDGKKCNKCSKIIFASNVSNPSLSNLSTSIVSPISSQYSNNHTEPPFRFKTDSISTSRMSASVITEDETTESTFPQSPCHSRLSKMPPEKTSVWSSSSSSKAAIYKSAESESGISLNFTAIVKDPKSGKSHPLNVMAKCLEGTPARVYINGKAFGPCQEE